MSKIQRPPRSNDPDDLAEWYEQVEFEINKLIAATSAYTVTNGSTDRAYDANATSIDEIADVLGTLITDLKAKGIIT